MDAGVAQLLDVGRLTHRMIREQQWMKRRVETVDLLSPTRIRRRVTIDIDTNLIRAWTRSDVLLPLPRVPVPLGVTPKILLLDFDVRSASNDALSLLTSDEDSAAAAGACLAALEQDGFLMELITPSLREHVKNVVRQLPSEVDVAAGAVADGNAVPESWYVLPSEVSDDETRIWQRMVDYNNFADLLQTFTTKFMPMVEIDTRGGVAVVKWAYSETQQPATPIESRRSKLRVSWQGVIHTPAVGNAGREHTRILVPDGLRIESATLSRQDGPLLPGFISTNRSKFHYQRRIAPDQAVIYTNDVPAGEHFIALILRPARTGFLRQARSALAASAVLLIAGTLLGFFTQRLDDSAREAAVVLLLVVPSLLLALLAREGEHELVSDLLLFPRSLLAVSAGLNVAAGGALALGFSGLGLDITWAVCAVGVVACFGFFVIINRYARDVEKSVLDNSAAVQSTPIRVLTSRWPAAVLVAETPEPSEAPGASAPATVGTD